MRRVIRIATWMSVAVVVGAFFWIASLVGEFNEWASEPTDNTFLLTLLGTAYIAVPALAVIWLVVFVVFVVRKGVRTLE